MKRPFDVMTEALNKIGQGNSGGATSFEDLSFFERITPEQPCIWYTTRWFESEEFPQEEIKIITVFLCRKKGLLCNTTPQAGQ